RHALCHASDLPQAARIVEIARISQAMPERIAVDDLRTPRGVLVAGVAARDHRAARADLSDDSCRQRIDALPDAARDGHDRDLDARRRSADARTVTALDTFAQALRELGPGKRRDG